LDFSDGYFGQTDRVYVDAEQAARAIFIDPPQMVQGLTALRNAIVQMLGIKPGTAFSDRGLGKIDYFPIVSKTANEIVLGGDDKHLDFRIWIGLQPSERGSEVTISTLVKVNNLFGRFYLSAIMPFHKLLSRSLLGRAVNGRDDTY
jgi:hypothetical protein